MCSHFETNGKKTRQWLNKAPEYWKYSSEEYVNTNNMWSRNVSQKYI